MTYIESLTESAEEVLNAKWDQRDGNVIPDSDSIKLSNGAVKVRATFLYADLADSSKIARVCPWETTAKIIRTYLTLATRLIRAYDGEIRSFDGDRVMGVFMGDYPNTRALNCGREIDWCVEKILNPKAQAKFESVRKNSLHIKHCVGIDEGEVVAVRAGIRNNNDLIWIGTAPSIAAKLSDIRNYPYTIYTTSNCFKKAVDSAKKNSSTEFWEATPFALAGVTQTFYRSKYTKQP